LLQCKQRKAFLDELAVSAGLKKKFVPGQAHHTQQQAVQTQKATFHKKQAGHKKDGVFMTQKRGDDDEDQHQHDSIEDMHHKSQDSYSMFGPDEDPDLNIYFNPPHTLLEYLTNLEEDNLFKINLV